MGGKMFPLHKLLKYFLIIFIFFIISCGKTPREQGKANDLFAKLSLGYADQFRKSATTLVSPTPGLNCRSGYIKLMDSSSISSCNGCHSASSKSGGVQLTNDNTGYTSALTKVYAGDSTKSALYISITTGTMKQYSNSSFNDLVKTWIDTDCKP